MVYIRPPKIDIIKQPKIVENKLAKFAHVARHYRVCSGIEKMTSYKHISVKLMCGNSFCSKPGKLKFVSKTDMPLCKRCAVILERERAR